MATTKSITINTPTKSISTTKEIPATTNEGNIKSVFLDENNYKIDNLKTYVNGRFSFSVDYPAAWKTRFNKNQTSRPQKRKLIRMMVVRMTVFIYLLKAIKMRKYMFLARMVLWKYKGVIREKVFSQMTVSRAIYIIKMPMARK